MKQSSKNDRTRKGQTCIEKINVAKKSMVAADRMAGMTQEMVAKKHGISARQLSRWEKGDEEYLAIIDKHTTDMRRAIVGRLFRDVEGVAANVMDAAREDAELGFKLLKEMGVLKTGGKELGMTQEEVAQAGGVTIQVNLGQPEAPVTVDSSAEVLDESNES